MKIKTQAKINSLFFKSKYSLNSGGKDKNVEFLIFSPQKRFTNSSFMMFYKSVSEGARE